VPGGNSDAIHAQDCTLIDVDANLVADQLAEINLEEYQIRVFICQSTGKIIVLRRGVRLERMSKACIYDDWERLAEIDCNAKEVPQGG
jgi:hypothetical protein